MLNYDLSLCLSHKLFSGFLFGGGGVVGLVWCLFVFFCKGVMNVSGIVPACLLLGEWVTLLGESRSSEILRGSLAFLQNILCL